MFAKILYVNKYKVYVYVYLNNKHVTIVYIFRYDIYLY